MAIVGEAFIELKPQVAANFNQQAAQQLGAPLEKAGVAAGKKASDALAKGASKGAGDAGKQAGKKFSIGLGDALQGLGAIVVARKVFGFFKDSIATLAEFEKLGAQTAAVIRSTGGAAGVSADQVAGLAGSLEDLTTVDDKAIQAGANLLLTFKKVRNEVGEGNNIFDRAVTAATDLSVALGTDVSGAALQLGKALEDPVTGLLALRRSGVSFTTEQRDLIKTLVESGNTLEAQKIILAELTTQFGGSAEALGGTLQGKLNRAADAFEELQKNVGLAIAPIVEFFAEIATSVASIPGPVLAVTAAFGGLIAVGIGIVKVRKVIGDTASELGKLAGGSARATAAFKTLGAAGAIFSGLTLAGEALGSFLTKADREATERAIPKLTTAMIALGQASSETAGGLDAAGKSFEEVFAAALGGRVSEVADTLAKLKVTIDSNVDGLKGFADIFDQILVDLQSQSPETAAAAFTELSKALDLTPEKAADVFDDYTIALGNTANAAKLAGGNQGDLNESAEDGTSAFDDLEKALREYNDTLNETLGVTLNAQEAADNLTKSKKDLAAQLLDNGGKFKGNSDAALENRDALRDVIEKADQYADALILAGKASVESKPDLLIASLKDLARKVTPEAREQIRLYIEKVRLADTLSITTPITITGLKSAVIGLDNVATKLKNLDKQGVNISVDVIQNSHSGGWIGGAGAGAFDIPITAQGGEFMLRRSSAGLTSKAFGPGFLSMWNQASSIDQLRKLFGGLKLHAGGPIPAAASVGASAVVTFAPQITIVESRDPRDTANQVTRALGRTADDLRRVKGRG